MDYLEFFETEKSIILNRIIWFSITIFINSLFNAINLIANSNAYQNNILANSSFEICIIGYICLVLSSFLSLIQQCNIFGRDWRKEQKFGRLLAFITLIGVLFIQSRTFADLFVFCLISLMMAADNQVVKETKNNIYK